MPAVCIGVPARCEDWAPAVGTELPASCVNSVLAVLPGVPAKCVDWGASCENRGAGVSQLETGPLLTCSLHVWLFMALMFSSSNFNKSRSLNQIAFLTKLKMCFSAVKRRKYP